MPPFLRVARDYFVSPAMILTLSVSFTSSTLVQYFIHDYDFSYFLHKVLKSK